MTLKEAIEHYKCKAKELEEEALRCDMKDKDDEQLALLMNKGAMESKQIVVWLTELLERRRKEYDC